MTSSALSQTEAGLPPEAADFGVHALPPGMERLRRLGQTLGRGAIARRACSVIRRLVMAGRPGPFDVEVFPGQNARLYPAENLSDKRVFAGVQFWDWAERAALGRRVREADEPVYFVDAGANAGLYTLAVRAEAGPKRVVILAIEPDAENLARLRFNIAASGAGADVTIAPVALSDRAGTVHLAANHANRGELALAETGTPVAAKPLLDVVREAEFPRIDALKIDIEGLELTVLRPFFEAAPKEIWPKMLILEARRGEITDALTYLCESGYGISERTRMNAVLRLDRMAAEG